MSRLLVDDIFRGGKNLSVKSSNFGSRPAATVLPGNKTEALMVIRKLTVTAAIFFSFLSLLFFLFFPAIGVSASGGDGGWN